MKTLITLTLLAAWPGYALAEASTLRQSAATPTGRVLGGHHFIPSSLVTMPFVTTYFGTTTGAGLRRGKLSYTDPSTGEVTNDPLNMAAFDEGFELGIALTRWLGVQAGVGGLIFAGSDISSALGVGAFFNLRTHGGVVVRILQKDRFYLSGKVGGAFLTGKQLNPLNMLQITPAGEFDFDSSRLLTDLKAWGAGPTLAAAFAISPFLGLQSSVGFEFGEIELGPASVSTKILTWGAGATLDGRAARIPVAVPLVYQLTKDFGDGSAVEHRLESGAFYSGREHLNLGLMFATRIGDDDREYLGQFRMYYYW